MAEKQPKCTVCRHRDHAAVDLGLARGVSVRALARRYGLTDDALYRHSRNHLPPQLRAKLITGPSLDVDVDKLREDESHSLLGHLVALRGRLFASLDTAEECGDGTMLARLAGQLHHNLEITGKLLGDLSSGGTTVNNVLVLPAYVELRSALTKALAPYPEARKAVAEALHGIEAKAARDIAQDTGRATLIEARLA